MTKTTTRTIEVDEATAELLKARAAARGITVSGLLADLVGAEEALPPGLKDMRRAGTGPLGLRCAGRGCAAPCGVSALA